MIYCDLLKIGNISFSYLYNDFTIYIGITDSKNFVKCLHMELNSHRVGESIISCIKDILSVYSHQYDLLINCIKNVNIVDAIFDFYLRYSDKRYEISSGIVYIMNDIQDKLNIEHKYSVTVYNMVDNRNYNWNISNIPRR
jgi:hypothetical protein